jgi:hypothetical protein
VYTGRLSQKKKREKKSTQDLEEMDFITTQLRQYLSYGKIKAVDND